MINFGSTLLRTVHISNVLPQGVRVLNKSNCSISMTRNSKSHDVKKRHKLKRMLCPPGDAISNQSAKTIRSMRTITLRGTTPLETHLDPKKIGNLPQYSN